MRAPAPLAAKVKPRSWTQSGTCANQRNLPLNHGGSLSSAYSEGRQYLNLSLFFCCFKIPVNAKSMAGTSLHSPLPRVEQLWLSGPSASKQPPSTRQDLLPPGLWGSDLMSARNGSNAGGVSGGAQVLWTFIATFLVLSLSVWGWCSINSVLYPSPSCKVWGRFYDAVVCYGRARVWWSKTNGRLAFDGLCGYRWEFYFVRVKTHHRYLWTTVHIHCSRYFRKRSFEWNRDGVATDRSLQVQVGEAIFKSVQRSWVKFTDCNKRTLIERKCLLCKQLSSRILVWNGAVLLPCFPATKYCQLSQ